MRILFLGRGGGKVHLFYGSLFVSLDFMLTHEKHLRCDTKNSSGVGEMLHLDLGLKALSS